MRKSSFFAFAALALGFANADAQPSAQKFSAKEIEQGRYVAIAGDCAACHTAPVHPGEKPSGEMAGGYPINSPLGAIYSSNITPSSRYGIGAYSEAEFARAVRSGIRRDGAPLYPAMPYPSYAKLTDADIHALYAYFMTAVKPIDSAAPTTNLPFPFNIRTSMRIWNAMFVDEQKIAADPARSAQWNRGRYLSETLGHCSTCHSPRGLMMQESKSAPLSGGPLGSWFAPNITPDKVSGIGGWSREEIARYLSTGSVPGKGQAAGEMAEAVTHSFSRMNPADVQAIAEYIATVPAVRDDSDKQAAYSFGHSANFETALRGDSKPALGSKLYSGLCAACHGRNGDGSPDGTIPSLHHNSTVGASRSDNLVSVILHGVDRTVGDRHVLMPGFGEASFVQSLTNAQIADLATFVRQTFGPGDSVTEKQVAVARTGSSFSIILLVVRSAMVLGALLLAGIAFWRLRRTSGGKTA